MTEQGNHISVLYDEVMEALNPQPDHLYIDGTLGAGGHTKGILERGGRVLAFDWDLSTIEITRKTLHNYSTQVQYHHANYAEMAKWAPYYGFGQVDGVLLDLGLSSRQLDDPQRGFSFRADGPLDMRFDQSGHNGRMTAAEIVNTFSAHALADIFFKYGEIRQSRKLAREITNQRPLNTTKELLDLINNTIGRGKRQRHSQIAAQAFQALRIAVNKELEAVERGLQAGIDLLRPGGRIAVISFHSLEDRLVKQTFRKLSDPYYNQPKEKLFVNTSHIVLQRITRKPITPSAAEIKHNPRSRSAKLRVAEKVTDPEQQHPGRRNAGIRR
ncbi:MAG: 16S rRNA (cytosine(1402)-N(4))-methyltransferase RsmH [Ardenticatenaceae bacterium]|nr:16S rRNA (cytosine(1402)-N(4))-methyltransferase RsmH [Ardenticatenaceae bacterium]